VAHRKPQQRRIPQLLLSDRFLSYAARKPACTSEKVAGKSHSQEKKPCFQLNSNPVMCDTPAKAYCKEDLKEHQRFYECDKTEENFDNQQFEMKYWKDSKIKMKPSQIQTEQPHTTYNNLL
jgi:hypothetical protein